MRGICILTMLFWLILPVRAAQSAEVEGVWEQAQQYGIEAQTGLEEGVSLLAKRAAGLVGEVFRTGLAAGMRLMCVVLLCGIAEGVCVGKGALDAVRLAGALAVTGISVSSMDAMIGLGRETIGQLGNFSQVLLPAMAVLTAAAGQVTAAAMRQGATVLFAQLLIALIDRLLIPMVYAYVACSCAWAAVGNEGLKKLGGILKSVITAILTATLLIFVGYLTVSGAVVGSADAAAIKTAKFAISRAVPVVGGILSDAAESVLVGAGVLRSSVGVVGLLVVLAICVGPFLQLAVHYLSYKLTAALTGTVAEQRLSGLLDNIGGAFGLVLGMTGACALVLMISIAAAISAVSV